MTFLQRAAKPHNSVLKEQDENVKKTVHRYLFDLLI
jgi:hypothetical protein